MKRSNLEHLLRAAGREKDHAFVRETIIHGLASESVLLTRIDQTTLDAPARQRLACGPISAAHHH